MSIASYFMTCGKRRDLSAIKKSHKFDFQLPAVGIGFHSKTPRFSTQSLLVLETVLEKRFC